jgi:uncharacterized protein (DUF2147 family)
MKVSFMVGALLLTASTVFGAGHGDVLGLWTTEGGDSKVELYRCGESICGKIAWLKHPGYIDSADGPTGAAKVDRHNPEPGLRNRPIMGLKVIDGLREAGDSLWNDGTCYDPQSGNTYQCKLHLDSPTELKVRGFIGISLIGRTFMLTRERPQEGKASLNGPVKVYTR